MRHVIVAAALLLVACDSAKPVETAAADEPAKTSEQLAAEQACGELTGYRADTATASAEDELRRQEYLACVDNVTKSATPGLRGRST